MIVTNGQLRGKLGAANDVYPVQAQVEYRLKQGKRVLEVGRAQTVSLSSREVVLDSKQHLAPGMEIELIMGWPGPVANLGHLVLRVQGRTVAGRGVRTKVQIGQYDFAVRANSNRALKPKPLKMVGAAPLPHAAPFAS